MAKEKGDQLKQRSIIGIEVQCYAGYRAEETPRSIRLGSRMIGVKQVLDRWLDPDYRYFKLLGDDEGVYIIRYDTQTRTWELTFFQGSTDGPLQT